MNFVIERFTQSWVLQRNQRAIASNQAEDRNERGHHTNGAGDVAQKVKEAGRFQPATVSAGSMVVVRHHQPEVIQPVHHQQVNCRPG